MSVVTARQGRRPSVLESPPPEVRKIFASGIGETAASLEEISSAGRLVKSPKVE